MNVIVIMLCLALLIAFVAYLQLWRRYRRDPGKVTFMSDAIDIGDHTFQFPINEKYGSEPLLNESLNCVKEILQHARDKQIEREKYLELILDSVDTGVLVVDVERGIVFRSNRAAFNLLQVGTIAHINQIKEKMAGFSLCETHTILKSRRVRIISFSDIKGELANQEIDSWVKLIRVFTHEIINIVTPIISLSDVLLQNSQGEQRQGLEVISRIGGKLMRLVENYHKFTHVPTSTPTLFYVKPFLERMVNLIRPMLKSDVSVSCEVEPGDLLVYADESLVSRMVSNLLKNASEAIGKEGQIILCAYTNTQESAIIDITDNGAMILDDMASHILVPLFTTKPQGSGIGLSISRQIMQACNSFIDLITDKTDGLTTF